MKHEKFAPGLLSALETYKQRGAAALESHIGTIGIVSDEGSSKPPRAIVFLRCSEEASLSHLDQYDIYVNQTRGAIRTAFVPLDSLEALSDDDTVRRVFPTRYLRPLMDVAAPHVAVPQFRSNNSLTGRGIVVGVVDTGIDASHAMFANRIARIWDQTIPGPGVLDGAYGAELTGPLMTVSRDTNGHGTHVTGIAAGDDALFGGIAPDATLVIVKSDLNDGHITDGIRYIFRVSNEIGADAAVVNLSLGGHADAHDGTDPLAFVIDQESGPGRIVCCAAGNEGNDNIHARVNLTGGADHTLRFHVPTVQGQSAVTNAALNAWYPGTDIVEVAVETPSGFFTPFQGPVTSGRPDQTHFLPDAEIRVTAPGPDPDNGDHNVLVEMWHPTNRAMPVTAGTWRLHVRSIQTGGGTFDAWTLDNSSTLDVLFTSDVDDRIKIGSPGAARSAVTVASFTTKNAWTDIDFNARQVGLPVNDISAFSSEGPLRDGARKPDVAAPGAMIVSALSTSSTPKRHWMLTGGFRANAGTSMACPFISGVVALLLERDPSLDPAGVKNLLHNASTIPGAGPGVFDPKWGFGLTDAGIL